MCKGTASYTGGKVIDIRNQGNSVREAEKCSTVPWGRSTSCCHPVRLTCGT